MTSIVDLPHIGSIKNDNRVVEIDEDIIRRVLPNFGVNIAAVTEKLKTIYWKLWMMYLIHIRLPSTSPDISFSFYLQASHNANHILRKYVDIVGNRIDINCDARRVEGTVIARELIDEILITSLDSYNKSKPKTSNNKPLINKENKAKANGTKAQSKRIQKKTVSNKKGQAFVPIKRRQMNSNLKKGKLKRQHNAKGDKEVTLNTQEELKTVEELDFDKVIDPNYKKRSNYAILKLTEEGAKKCSRTLVATPLQPYKVDKEYIDSASKDVNELFEKGICLIASTANARRTLERFSLTEQNN